MLHERHQHTIDRHAQLIREAQADHLTRALKATRLPQWPFTWSLMRVTLHLPVVHVRAGQGR